MSYNVNQEIAAMPEVTIPPPIVWRFDALLYHHLGHAIEVSWPRNDASCWNVRAWRIGGGPEEMLTLMTAMTHEPSEEECRSQLEMALRR